MTTSSDGKFRLWDLESGKLVGSPLPGADVQGWGTYYPDGNHVIAVFADGTGVIWTVDPTTWEFTLRDAKFHNGEAVTSEHEPSLARVPDRDGEHAAEAVCEVEPPLLVCVDDRLGIGARPEAVAEPFELVRQLGVVVDLAVLNHRARSVFVRERLVTVLEVDDREAPRGKCDAAVDEASFRVGPAVQERRGHRGEAVAVDGASGRGDPADSAHGAESR